VRAFTDDRKEREAWMKEICERLDAHSVQQIGKVLVIYRENPKPAPPPKASPARKAAPPRWRGAMDSRPPTEALGGRRRGNDGAKADPRGGGKRGPRGGANDGAKAETKRTSRPRSRTPSPPPASAPRRRRRETSR
jgi:hypothetical protein